MQVMEYLREDGSCPYKKWFDSLDPQAAAKVATVIYRLESGNTSAIKWFAGLGEYRIDWGPGYRIYLMQDGDELIDMLGGGSQRLHLKDIDPALQLA